VDGCTTYHAACGIETYRVSVFSPFSNVAPHIMLRAALKRRAKDLGDAVDGCTTYHAACGIETVDDFSSMTGFHLLHHISCCVRH